MSGCRCRPPEATSSVPGLPSPHPHTADMSIHPPSLWRQNIAIISINIGYCCPKNAVTKQIWRWKNYSGVCFLYCDVQLNEISSGYLLYICGYISGMIYIVWQFAFFSHIIFPLPISPPVTTGGPPSPYPQRWPLDGHSRSKTLDHVPGSRRAATRDQ